MSQPKAYAPSPISTSRKRSHDEVFEYVEPETTEWAEGEVEEGNQFEMEPSAKRAKAIGRPPRADVPCPHGSTIKKCQKCVYQHRMTKLVENHSHRSLVSRILLLWSHNLVYLGTLASVVALPSRDPVGYERVCHVIDSRVSHFQLYQEQLMESLKEKNEDVSAIVSEVSDSLRQASPITAETSYMARWLISRYNEEDAARSLKALIGEASSQLTHRVSDAWDDKLFCSGIVDASYVEHFRQWKDTAWYTKDGLYASKVGEEEAVRSHLCVGFSDQPGQMCTKCTAVRRHLQRERSAYKTDCPGQKLVLNSLAPGLRSIADTVPDRITIENDTSLTLSQQPPNVNKTHRTPNRRPTTNSEVIPSSSMVLTLQDTSNIASNIQIGNLNS